jgi:hypothetical protein
MNFRLVPNVSKGRVTGNDGSFSFFSCQQANYSVTLFPKAGGKVDRKELEIRIWGKSIALARQQGIISEAEAQFLLDEYLNEVKAKILRQGGGLNFCLPKVSRLPPASTSPRTPRSE